MKLLVIDDDLSSLELISAALEQPGLTILSTSEPEQGLSLVRQHSPQVVLLDLMMPRLNGMEVLQRIVSIDPTIDVILMTGYYSTDSAVEAIQRGASDYLTKPVDVHRLRERIARMLAEAQRRHRAAALDEQSTNTFQFQGIIGRNPAMMELFDRIRRVAPHFRTALVNGATGTGKELVARALHDLSSGAHKPFAVCNCGAVVETLIESELFGYVRGAFTGALQDKVGLFEFANGGTVFLDEIGELPLAAQAKLLRVLQNQEIQRIGSPAVRKIDLRVVAATNRDLQSMVKDREFREDLYYRLSSVSFSLPPLAERMEDFPLLQRHVLQRFCKEYGRQITGISRRAQSLLARHTWPGNVRELENAIGHAVMMCAGNVIAVEDLPQSLREGRSALADDGLISLEEVQRRHARRVLNSVGGNKLRAAEILGISRGTLYKLLEESAGGESVANAGC